MIKRLGLFFTTMLFFLISNTAHAYQCTKSEDRIGQCAKACNIAGKCQFIPPEGGSCYSFCLINNQPSETIYLDNGILQVGFRLDWGGVLTEIHYKGGPNMVNNLPYTGREIQVDLRIGKIVNHTETGINPTEAGTWWKNSVLYKGGAFDPNMDYKVGSPLVDYSLDQNNHTIWTKTVPLDFGVRKGNCPLTEFYFEKEVSLDENVIKFQYNITYWGKNDLGQPGNHELPALFAVRNYDTFIYYDGETPWKNAPVSSTTYQDIANEAIAEGKTQAHKNLGTLKEYWVSVVDENGFGLTLAGFDLPEAIWLLKAEAFLGTFQASTIFRVDPTIPIRKGTQFSTTFYVIVDYWQNARKIVYELAKKAGLFKEKKGKRRR
jgi:hypothetical protein